MVGTLRALDAVEDAVGGRLGHVVDDVAVGEEDDPVGVGRGHGSWVTITMVWPISRTALRMNDRISAPVLESRLPVGSSAKMIAGSAGQGPGDGDPLLLTAGELARAVVEAVAEADGADDRVEPGRSGLRPARSIGRVMFSNAVSVGTRLKAWKTKPTRRVAAG